MPDTVLITGAGSGLGLALRSAFHAAGHKCLLFCHSNPTYEIDHNTERVVTGDLNVGDVVLEAAHQSVSEDVGILINNAGVYLNKSFADTHYPDLYNVINTNLTSVIGITRAVWPHLKERGRGFVININSLAGLSGSNGEAVYCASKHGLAGFSKALQFEGVKDNVRVINLYLGGMDTKMTNGRPGQGKFIDPNEVAELIVTLCTDYSTLRITELTIQRKNY
jgi:acetoacetyl-CoA reductase